MSALAKHMVSRPTLSRFLLLSDMCFLGDKTALEMRRPARRRLLCAAAYIQTGSAGEGAGLGATRTRFQDFSVSE